MKKFNRSFSQALILGASAALVGNIMPAQAQTPTQILNACAEKNPNDPFLTKCDPNADKVKDSTNLPNNQPGLDGSFNVIPTQGNTDPLLATGLALEGTGLKDANGNPVFNIDFSLPSQVKRTAPGSSEVEYDASADPNNLGNFRVLASTLDFENLLDWKGTIKDLTTGTGAFGGAPFPTSATGPRVENFMVIDQKGAGSGEIDGEPGFGVALDLISIGLPSFQSDSNGTSLSFDLVLQSYKLDAAGHRLEEQERLPDTSDGRQQYNVYANTVTGRLSAAIAGFTPAQVKAEIDESGELFAWYGYDITFDSQPGSQLLISGETHKIPEPTTIISSLLLMGGGAFKFSKRKNS